MIPRALAWFVVALAVAACAPTTSPTPLPRPASVDPSDAGPSRTDLAYAKCKEQEALGDASTCWLVFLRDNTEPTADARRDYAQMYIRHHGPSSAPAREPRHPGGPCNYEHWSGQCRYAGIAIDRRTITAQHVDADVVYEPVDWRASGARGSRRANRLRRVRNGFRRSAFGLESRS